MTQNRMISAGCRLRRDRLQEDEDGTHRHRRHIQRIGRRPGPRAAAKLHHILHGVVLRPERRMAQMPGVRSEEHTSELQSLMRSSYAVFCLNKNMNSAHHQKRLVEVQAHITTAYEQRPT